MPYEEKIYNYGKGYLPSEIQADHISDIACQIRLFPCNSGYVHIFYNYTHPST